MGFLSKVFGSKSKTPVQKAKKTREPVKPTSNWEPAAVKWFNTHKGFGFLAAGDGGKDIFVHASTLERCDIKKLDEGQKIEVRWGVTPKGREAAEMRLTKQ